MIRLVNIKTSKYIRTLCNIPKDQCLINSQRNFNSPNKLAVKIFV